MAYKDEYDPTNAMICCLPEDLLLNIFSYLPKSVLYFTIRNVCSTWRKISENSSLWKSFDLDREYSNVPKDDNDENDDVIRKFRKWLKGISQFLLKLIVYHGYHDDVLGGVKGHLTIFPKLQTLDITYGESPDGHLITIDIMEKIFPNLTELRFQCFKILPYSVLDNIHILHRLKRIRFIYKCCECCMKPDETDTLNNYFQNWFMNFPNVIEVEANMFSNDTVATVLHHCGMLETFSLAESTKIGVDAFKKMPLKETLLTLNVDKSSINDSCLEIILKNSPNLRFISVKECSHITDIGLSYIGKYSKHLETLLIEEDPDVYREITDVGIESVASGCIHLKVLSANWQEKITNRSLISLSEHCQKLSKIEMAGCDITDSGIKILSENCHRLRYVEFSVCIKITHKSVEHLAKNCLCLKEVIFINCRLINRAQISKCFKNLNVIL